MELKGQNIIDKVVGFISPRNGISRINARRSYEAASSGRRTKSLKGANSTGPNLELNQAFQTLRNRSRHFVRNNGWAKRALTVIVDNVIGEGIRPAPVGTKNQVKRVKQLWHSWAESTDCDYYGKNTFYGLQALIMSEIAEGGDCLILRRRIKPTKPNQLPIQLQVVEGDQLDQNRNYRLSVTINGKEISGYARLGVQYDDNDKVIGYWVWPRHPYDMTPIIQTIISEFWPVEDVIHPFEILRVGQVRGVPMGVAGFMRMSDFSDYEDAQLMRQKVAAAFAGFITGRAENAGTEMLERLEPGAIEYLNENETITFPTMPNPSDDGWSKRNLQGIAAAYSITYEQLTLDYSNVNYTSGRMAKLDSLTNFKRLQYNTIVPQVCAPVWDWFMSAILITGLSANYIECGAMDWTAPPIKMIDPTKEFAAYAQALANGLTTWPEVIRGLGRDKDEFLQEIIDTKEELGKLGISFDWMAVKNAINQTNNNQNEQKPAK